MELHNFAPNAILQAAVFVAVCEGYLGIPVHWDLWRHLFRGGLYTESVTAGVRRPVPARLPDASSTGVEERPLHPVHDDDEQP